ncbi:MAG: phosphate ABC transporter permease subunit PstC, partial [Thermoleophilaceae bacterium]
MPRHGEKAIYALLVMCAVVSVVTTTAIVFSLLSPTLSFFGDVPIGDFLFGTEWSPQFGDQAEFGV